MAPGRRRNERNERFELNNFPFHLVSPSPFVRAPEGMHMQRPATRVFAAVVRVFATDAPESWQR